MSSNNDSSDEEEIIEEEFQVVSPINTGLGNNNFNLNQQIPQYQLQQQQQNLTPKKRTLDISDNENDSIENEYKGNSKVSKLNSSTNSTSSNDEEEIIEEEFKVLPVMYQNNNNSFINRQQQQLPNNNNNNYRGNYEEVDYDKIVIPDNIPENLTFNKNNIGNKLMERYGYRAGEGAGHDSRGVKSYEEVAPAYQNTQIGIGAPSILPDFYKSQQHSVSEEELDFPVRQEIHYIKSSESNNTNKRKNEDEEEEDYLAQLNVGKPEDPPIRGEFCSPEMIKELETHKTGLDDLDRRLFDEARRKSNPYEQIRGSIFINRAAVKMANLDRIVGFLQPEKPVPGKSNNFIYFADVCAGPGGFTEYTYWKKTKHPLTGESIYNDEDNSDNLDDLLKGWGFTLKGDCDWKLNKFSKDIPIRNFQIEYGQDDDGDILKSHNIKHFANVVDKGTQGKGLNFFMADGGVNTDGAQNKQELLLQQLILCQFITMFDTLGEGGHFVCKIFDTFNSFTVGLLYIIYKHFKEFAIIKPFTSRPLNSERYVVGKFLLKKRPKVIDYLYMINELCNKKENVLEIIKRDTMDEEFIDYITKTSTEICAKQIRAFELFKKYVEDPNLVQPDHNEIRKKSLEEWGLPQETKREREFVPRGRGGGGGYRGGYRGRGSFRGRGNYNNNNNGNNNYNNYNNYNNNNGNNYNNYNNQQQQGSYGPVNNNRFNNNQQQGGSFPYRNNYQSNNYGNGPSQPYGQRLPTNNNNFNNNNNNRNNNYNNNFNGGTYNNNNNFNNNNYNNNQQQPQEQQPHQNIQQKPIKRREDKPVEKVQPLDVNDSAIAKALAARKAPIKK